MPTIKDNSRGTWTGLGTIEHINAGSLQRIADATEKIAVNYDDLLRDKKSAEESRDYWRGQAERGRRQISALRGVITRMKRARS